jgi:hypothetical protein
MGMSFCRRRLGCLNSNVGLPLDVVCESVQLVLARFSRYLLVPKYRALLNTLSIV